MSAEISVCRECASSAIQIVGTNVRGRHTSIHHRCRECGARFKTPKTRKSKTDNPGPMNGLAHELWKIGQRENP